MSNGLAIGLYIILATHKIPEEVAPIHIVQLIGKEVVEVLTERRLGEALTRHRVIYRATEVQHLASHHVTLLVCQRLTILVTQNINLCAVCSPRLIGCLALVGVPQTGEEVHKLRRVGVIDKLCHLLITATLGIVVVRCLLHNIIHGRRVVGSIQQRAVTILIAIQHCQQSVRIVGVVAVHRGIGNGTNRYGSVRREADKNHRRGNQNQIPYTLAGTVCAEDKVE